MSERDPTTQNERDEIAVLMRAAGKRSAVPRERFDRARDAARAEWQQTVDRRSTKRRRVWVAASVAAAAVLALAMAIRFGPFGTPGTPGTLSTVNVAAIVGSGQVDDGNGQRDLAAGEPVRIGAALWTASESRLGLVFPSGHAVRVDEDSRVRLLDEGAIALDAGAVYIASSIDGDPAAAVAVHTPLGIVREIGTQFEVRLEDGSVRVRLREGAATVSHGADTHEVVAGGELRLDPDGTVTRGEIASYATEWNWLHDVTTTPTLDGRTARSFLDWVARERGLTLTFADAEVALAAEATILGGTTDYLTVAEALDAVLPTCRLTYRIDAGTLIVDEER